MKRKICNDLQVEQNENQNENENTNQICGPTKKGLNFYKIKKTISFKS